MTEFLYSSARLRLASWIVGLMLLVGLLGSLSPTAEAAIDRFSGRVYTGRWHTLYTAYTTNDKDAGHQIRVRMEVIPSPIYLKAELCNGTPLGDPVLILAGDTRTLYTLARFVPPNQCFRLVGKRANGFLLGWADIRGRVSH